MANDDPPPTAHHSSSGQRTILALVAVGIVGGLGSWWYYQRLQRRVLALWGTEAASLILRAPRAEALVLDEADGSPELELGGTRFSVKRRVDVSRAAGLVHLRHSLINDRSFDWSPQADECQPRWQYALRFVDGDRQVAILLAPNCRLARLASGTRGVRTVSIAPLAAALERFLVEQFE